MGAIPIGASMGKTKFKNDKYRKSCGGYSRLLSLSCAKCGAHLFDYQKDGPGILKRLYLDRVNDLKYTNKELVCPKCKEVLGLKGVYKKENRPAIHLFVGSVSKKIVKQL
ncbi:MAG: hypothetical protein HY505_03350 [Candidatus Yanofskybacteria bacterium]|nr:hypothetical protein [Candidatus Yanofskybacteria bacterium]